MAPCRVVVRFRPRRGGQHCRRGASMTAWLMMERSPGDRAPFVARVGSVGRRLPETRLPTDELMASTRHRTGVDLERLTGVQERRVSVGDEDSLTLAAGAALDCLARSHSRAEALDVVVGCSITKYRDGLVQWLEPPTSLAGGHPIRGPNAT